MSPHLTPKIEVLLNIGRFRVASGFSFASAMSVDGAGDDSVQAGTVDENPEAVQGE